MTAPLESLCVTFGRILLGLYFIGPGLLKVFGWEATAESMLDKNMIMVPFFLGLTILIQLGGGAAMVVGYKTKPVAFVLAGITLVISLVMHNFWTMPVGELQTNHELQNFIKNMGIMAGLLMAAGLGAGPWSLDNRKKGTI